MCVHNIIECRCCTANIEYREEGRATGFRSEDIYLCIWLVAGAFDGCRLRWNSSSYWLLAQFNGTWFFVRSITHAHTHAVVPGMWWEWVQFAWFSAPATSVSSDSFRCSLFTFLSFFSPFFLSRPQKRDESREHIHESRIFASFGVSQMTDNI